MLRCARPPLWRETMKKLQMQPGKRLKALIPSANVLKRRAKKALASLSLGFTVAMTSATTAFATTTTTPGTQGGQDIWTWLDYALGDLYNKFLSVSTIAACVAASVCLILMNFSTDDRAVATSRSWLKRILLSWVILNVLGFIMTYLINLTQGGSYVP